jgi:DeoR family transcriptional regulator of aga operon
MIAAAARSIVVADGTKLGVAHHSRVAPLSDVDGLITSSDADSRVIRQLERAGLPITLAT